MNVRAAEWRCWLSGLLLLLVVLGSTLARAPGPADLSLADTLSTLAPSEWRHAGLRGSAPAAFMAERRMAQKTAAKAGGDALPSTHHDGLFASPHRVFGAARHSQRLTEALAAAYQARAPPPLA